MDPNQSDPNQGSGGGAPQWTPPADQTPAPEAPAAEETPAAEQPVPEPTPSPEPSQGENQGGSTV